MKFAQYIVEGFFSKAKKLDEKIAIILRIVTDIVTSWKIDNYYLVGTGTDMKRVAEGDLKRLNKQFPAINFEIFEERKGYFGIRTKILDNTLEYISKKGYR